MADNLTGFSRPDFPEILARARADINGRLPGADAFLRRSTLGVLAYVLAGAVHLLYGFLDWIARQSMPLHALGDNLDAWGAVWGVGRKQASAATGPVDFTGTNGATIPVDAELAAGDGQLYGVTVAATVAGGAARVTVAALAAGDAGNQDTGATLALSAAIAGIDSSGTVAAPGLTGGADREADGEAGEFDTDAYRGRILARIQAPPHGGAEEDYRQVALAVPGVTRAWVYPREAGAGSVTLRFMMDDTYSNGIPLGDPTPDYTGDLLAMFQAIEAFRPVTAEVFVAAPIGVALDLTITGLDPVTQTVKDAIEAEVADMLRRRAEPGGTIFVSWIVEAISIAAGEISHALTVPSADVTHTTGQIAVLGTITYA